jgi:hypothetical protein
MFGSAGALHPLCGCVGNVVSMVSPSVWLWAGIIGDLRTGASGGRALPFLDKSFFDGAIFVLMFA